MTTRIEQVLAFFGRHRESRHIKLITGMRGCGKSHAISVWIERLKLDGVKPENILYYDLEEPKNRNLHETEKLLDVIDAHDAGKDGKLYVILDEVCELHEFEAVIGVLHALSHIDLTLTCSNQRPISERFREYLSGRCVYMEMMTPSFAEVPLPKRTSFEARLMHVLAFGTLPYLNSFRNRPADLEERARVYLQGLWNTILVKDILSRNRLADSRLTEKLLGRIYEHLGEGESLRKIGADATIEGREASPNTVESYIDALDESLLVKKLPKFDAFTGETLKAGYRFYLGDLALGARRYGEFPGDPTNALRNLIALELAGRGGKVCCGRYDGSDFDFVVVRKDKYSCWQFAPDIVDDAVPTPVIAPLRRVPDDVPRTVIVRRDIPKRRTKGLEYVTLERFLMAKDQEK